MDTQQKLNRSVISQIVYQKQIYVSLIIFPI